MNSLCSKSNLLLAPLLFSVLVVSGCSGSGESSESPQTAETISVSNGVSADPVSDVSTVVNIANETNSELVGDVGSDANVNVDETDVLSINSDADIDSSNAVLNEASNESASNQITSNGTASNTTASDDVAPAASDVVTPPVQEPSPVVSNLTRVNFNIAVPAYSSDALRVRLVWGEKDINAAWVVDETWSVSDDFPKNTENPLIVIFYDENGAITLGSFESEFKTGTDESEIFTITAGEFNTDRWDTDSDGVSNLDELIVGTDYLVDESILPVFQNDLLRSLLPNRQTLFGQNIENIPNPDRTVADNLHVWEYDIVNDQLVHDNHEAPLAHQLAWQRYVELTLPEHREGVKVMKFLQDDDGLSSDLFIVGIGTAPTPGGVKVELQLSEPFVANLFNNHTWLSHVITWQHEYDVPTYALGATRVLWESPIRSFLQDYWEGGVYDTYLELRGNSNRASLMLEKFPGEFVNASATRGHSSDFAESFRFFVEHDTMPELGDFDGAEKVRWFWDYPEFVNIREYARAAF